MSDQAWFEVFFGEDYFEMYDGLLTPELTESQVDGLVNILGLPEGSRILDLACGHGRHAIPLAKRGYRVTGFDLSEVFLERARATAEQAGADVRWVRGDMRELPFDSEFDAAINVFTAFGYFADPKDDLRVLQGLERALVPGGRFLLETLNRDGLIGRFQHNWFDKTVGGAVALRSRSWDLASDVIDEEVTLMRTDGPAAQYRTSVRMRTLSGYIDLFRGAGLEPVEWYGGLGGTPLELTSFRLVIVAVKPPASE